jgi:hypothetical protein
MDTDPRQLLQAKYRITEECICNLRHKLSMHASCTAP